MTKPFTHTELSDPRCIKCGGRLKANVVYRKPGALYCYTCWRKIMLKDRALKKLSIDEIEALGLKDR